MRRAGNVEGMRSSNDICKKCDPKGLHEGSMVAGKAGMYRKGQSGEGDVKKGLCSNQPATERAIGSIVL
ncbi:hypothetical protein M0804_000682 [Polistes exclamans]|nr:hypothetical protein M0804_000682 [Polistes exclamans]